MTSTTERHFTAWLTTDRSCITREYCDVLILEDERTGAGPEWTTAIGATPLFAAETTAAPGGDHDQQAQSEAEEIMALHGWITDGDWTQTDLGYVITVERTPDHVPPHVDLTPLT